MDIKFVITNKAERILLAVLALRFAIVNDHISEKGAKIYCNKPKLLTIPSNAFLFLARETSFCIWIRSSAVRGLFNKDSLPVLLL